MNFKISWSEIQDGRPGLWFAETFFDFTATAEWILTKLDRKQVLNVFYQVCVFFFRADQKSKMAILAFDWLKHFSTSSPQPLNGFWRNDRKQFLKALYQVCVFRVIQKSKMAALASDWLKHFSTSSPQPLNGFRWNLTGNKSSTSSTKFVFFVPIANPRWLPWPLIGWNIFRLLLHNCWMDFEETW